MGEAGPGPAVPHRMSSHRSGSLQTAPGFSLQTVAVWRKKRKQGEIRLPKPFSSLEPKDTIWCHPAYSGPKARSPHLSQSRALKSPVLQRWILPRAQVALHVFIKVHLYKVHLLSSRACRCPQWGKACHNHLFSHPAVSHPGKAEMTLEERTRDGHCTFPHLQTPAFRPPLPLQWPRWPWRQVGWQWDGWGILHPSGAAEGILPTVRGVSSIFSLTEETCATSGLSRLRL